MEAARRPANDRLAEARLLRRLWVLVLVAGLSPVHLVAQTAAPEFRLILERLDGLERANRELMDEVKALRTQLAAANPSPKAGDAELQEQVAVQKQQIQDQVQTKVEAAQRFPIRLKGALIFNTFLNSKQGGESQYPSVASPRGDANGGAGLRQSVFGFDYQGPEVFGGGKLRASLLMDFYGASGQPLDQALRIRTATMEIDWKSRSLMAGVDRPVFAPREPSSLAQVGTSPLAGAGNLWMWIPQIRYEQRFRVGDGFQVNAQLAAVQTREIPSYQASTYVAEVERTRPGAEGRVEFAHNFAGGGRVEIAPGFHLSTSHVAHTAVPSDLFSADWLVRPRGGLEFTGAFFTGRNVSHLGDGGIGQGFAVSGAQQVSPLHSKGGWSQVTLPVSSRLFFHVFAGFQYERNRELPAGQIATNLAYGANLFYHLAPNLIVSLEASQVRTSYIQTGQLLNNHYDLAFAYLF